MGTPNKLKVEQVLVGRLILKLDTIMSFGGPQELQFLGFLWCLRQGLGPSVPSICQIVFLVCVWVFICCYRNPARHIDRGLSRCPWTGRDCPAGKSWPV